MTKTDNKASKEFKIMRYHSDEIRLILFICVTDLSKYDSDDLKIFAECIENRIEVLLTPEFLKSIGNFIKIDELAIDKFQDLKTILQSQYSSQWYLKMTSSSWSSITELSKEVIKLLELEYHEPLLFMENNLEVDWT